MKTLYINSSGFVGVDTEENTAFDIRSEREAISRIFIAPDNMHIVYDRGEKHYEMDAKKGDLIVSFYESSFEKPVIVVKSKDWLSNLKKYNEREQKAKEEWAKKNAEKCDCEAPCCESC